MPVAVQRPSVAAPLLYCREDPRACCAPSPLGSPRYFRNGVFLSLLGCFDLLPGHSPLSTSIQKSPLGCSRPLCGTCRENMHHSREQRVRRHRTSQRGCSSQPCSPGESLLHYLYQHRGEGRDAWPGGRVFHALLPAPARDQDLMTAHKATAPAPTFYILTMNHPFSLPCSPP